jgi:hypothetical protein
MSQQLNKDMNITTCKKICLECAFNGSTKDTLYAEAFDIIENGKLFPCHMYLKSKTGCEHLGTETLTEVQVCKGYIAYQKKYGSQSLRNTPIWSYLFSFIETTELDEILSLEELIANNKGLRERIYLGN